MGRHCQAVEATATVIVEVEVATASVLEARVARRRCMRALGHS